MVQHPPAARRAILRRLKQGEAAQSLVREARDIADPGHAGVTLLHLAADLQDKKLVRDALAYLHAVDRPGRMAEVWGDAIAANSSGAVVESAVEAVCSMPDGEWTARAIEAIAPHVRGPPARGLMKRALANTGFESAAKPVMDANPDLVDIVQGAPPEVAAKILARTESGLDAAIAAAWKANDNRESLRVLIWGQENPDAVLAIANGGSDAVVWSMAAARLDRLGQNPDDAFAKATEILASLTGPEANKAHRKLSTAMERAGREAPSAPEASNPTEPEDEPLDVAETHGDRHVLALVDGYAGGLGQAHVRAVARAAPLCVAFDLDLVLMGFPGNLKDLLRLVEAETNVGEGESYTRQLYNQHRLRAQELDRGVPLSWPGKPVATTPHPDDEKAMNLMDVQGQVCLLLGLGKQGLPKRLLNACPHHYELSGQRISMETATAMGILADRLGRVPLA